MTDVKTVCDYLLSNDNFLILMHASPDGDAIGSGYGLCRALTKLGKRVKCACSDAIGQRYSYMTEGYGEGDFEPEHVIAVDLADTKLLDSLEPEYAHKIELCIDHHISNKLDCPHKLLIAEAAAACEIIYDVIEGLGCEFDAGIADCLYTGIATDTGCFKFTNTTANTHIVAAKLIEKGADYGRINRIMFDTKSRARIEVERIALESIQYYLDNKCAVLTVTKQMQDMTTPDELEGITALTRQIEGVEIGVTLRYKGENRYKISVRTIEPIDASSICARLGGGGHTRAAGCEVNLPVDEAKKVILESVKKELGI